jgi:hypothetical protein
MRQRRARLDAEVDPKGKLLWDVVSLQLAAQAADQAALTNRAKDLMGTATIATTITGVILNDKLIAVVKGDVPIWWTITTALALVVLFACGLWAIQPRDYYFAPDAVDFYAVERESPDVSPGQLYRSLAEGFVEPEEGHTLLASNEEQLVVLDRLVRVETAALAALALLAFYLAFLIGIDPS